MSPAEPSPAEPSRLLARAGEMLFGEPEWPPASAVSRWERAGRWLLFLLLAGLFPVAMNRAVHNMGGTDFPEYYAAGRYVLQHAAIKPHAMTAYYLPSMDVAWAGIALLPLPVAAVVWYGLTALSYFGLVAAIRRYLLADIDPCAARIATLAAALLAVPLVLDQLCLGAFHTFMLWWFVAGLGRIAHGRTASGAALLGLAVWVKLLPLLGVAYLVLKRRFAPAFGALCVAVALDAILSVSVFGFTGAYQAHVDWLARDAAGTARELLSHPEHVAEQRVTNQSLPAVLRRTFTQLGYPSDSQRDLAAWTDLSARQLHVLYTGIAGVLLLAVAWFCRIPARRLSPGRASTEIALIVLSTLWFSPIAPSYHPIAAGPALAMILARRFRRLESWAVAALWLTALALHGIPHARAVGHMLWTTMLLGALLVWVELRAPAVRRDTSPHVDQPAPQAKAA